MILELDPKIVSPIWGGHKLAKLKTLKNPPATIGETWEISTHKEGPSIIKETGEKLSDQYKLNFLVKLLDTDDVLSVQVHPNDQYANLHEGDNGKNECWLILDVEPKGGIYLGFKKGITKQKFKEALINKEQVDQLLNFYEVKRGDFFFVPAGTIHAIGKGVTLVEVQQSSGVTYRVWDWNRLDKEGKSRELHVEKSFEVVVDDEEKNTLSYFKHRKNVLDLDFGNLNLLEDKNFQVEFYSMAKNQTLDIDLTSCMNGLVVLKGHLEISNKKVNAFQSILIVDEKKLVAHSQEEVQFILVK